MKKCPKCNNQIEYVKFNNYESFYCDFCNEDVSNLTNKDNYNNLSPLYKYYLDVQNKYPIYIILIQTGSFYEVFQFPNHKNIGYAEKVSRILGTPLLTKNKKESNSPLMTGFPVFILKKYLIKLRDKGEFLVIINQDLKTKKRSTKHL